MIASDLPAPATKAAAQCANCGGEAQFGHLWCGCINCCLVFRSETSTDLAIDLWNERQRTVGLKMDPEWNSQMERIAAAKMLLPDTQSIGSRVSRAIHQWRRDGGQSPTSLYLGSAEYRLLRVLITSRFAYLETLDPSAASGTHFMGLRVYRVLEPEHLKVC